MKADQGCSFLVFPAVGQPWSCPLLPNNMLRTGGCPSFLLGGRTEWLPRRRQTGQAQHQTHPGEGGENLAGVRAQGQQWEDRFARILGRLQDSKALSVFVTVGQSRTLPRPQCTRLFRALSPSMGDSHSSHAERGITGSVLQMKKLRPQEAESHAQIQKG